MVPALWVANCGKNVLCEQRRSAGEVAGIGMMLVGEHRVRRQAHFLCALDLAIPVGTLDRAAHQPYAVLPASAPTCSISSSDRVW